MAQASSLSLDAGSQADLALVNTCVGDHQGFQGYYAEAKQWSSQLCLSSWKAYGVAISEQQLDSAI